MTLPRKPPKKRTIIIGDARVTTEQESLALDLEAFGLNDIHDMIVDIVTRDVGKEIDAGNDPTGITVDGSRHKTLQQAEKKVTVIFAKALPVEALERLRSILISNIEASTTTRTGKLSNPANWEFILIRNGRAISLSGAKQVLMQQRDFIVLRPKIEYASFVNARVAAGSKSFDYRPTLTNKNGQYQNIKVAKRNQSLGFMAMTARAARGMAEFATFSVTVGTTVKFKVPGERRRYGTFFLFIRPRRGNLKR